MFTTILRCIIIYAIVLIIFRLMGKRQLGQLQLFEFVITLIIADLATLSMADKNTPLVNSIVPLFTLLILQFFISTITRKSVKIRRMLNGKPLIVISPQGIDYEMLKELNMNMSDLEAGLRCANCFNIEAVNYAIVETNGTITVLLKSEKEPATREDMKVNNESNTLPRMIICDGEIINENLLSLKVDKKIIDEIIKKVDVKSLKEIIYATMDDDKKVFLQARNKKTMSFNLGD